MKHYSKQNQIWCAGYTLLEVAIVTLIIGLGFASAGAAYDVWRERQRVIITDTALAVTTGSIGSFRAQFGRYPCPAPMTSKRLEESYGREAEDVSGDTFCALENIAVGTCSSGVCVEQSEREVTLDMGTPDLADDVIIRPRVIKGALPFKELGMREDNAYDGYGNKIMYAVTERLAVRSTFEPFHGGISIVSEEDKTIIDEPGSAHFVIFSPGQNGRGAYTNEGVQISDCDYYTATGGSPPDGGGPKDLEKENCDTSATESKFLSATRRETGGVGNFDDKLAFFSSANLNLWEISDEDDFDITQRPSGVVGFNDTDPLDNITEIGGTLRALDNLETDEDVSIEGKIYTVSGICAADPLSDICFNTALIADPDSEGIKCVDDATQPADADPDYPSAAGGIAYRISEGKLRCQADYPYKCPENSAMKGISEDGSIICSDLPTVQCPTTTFEVCRTHDDIPLDGTITSGSEGNLAYVMSTPPSIYTGYDYAALYKCVEIDDTGEYQWEFESSTGTCQCPILEPYTDWQACAVGYIGDGNTVEVTSVCNQADWTDWTTTYEIIGEDNCTCVGGPEQEIVPCPEGQNKGAHLRERLNTCTDGDIVNGEWSDIQNDCRCEDTSETEIKDCPDPESGTYTLIREYSCVDFSTTETDDQETACACEDKVLTEQISCPDGFEGNRLQTTTITCDGEDPVVKIAGEGEPGYNCTPEADPVCSWAPNGSSLPLYSAPYGIPEAGDECTCGTSDQTCYTVVNPGVEYARYSCSCIAH